MKSWATLLACLAVTFIDASDISPRLEWNWHRPPGMLPSGHAGATRIANDVFTFGTRGKITSVQEGSLRHPTTESTIRDVAQGAATILAVGDRGLIWQRKSTHWIELESGTSNDLSSAVFAQSKWVVVGSDIVLCSSDPTNWVSVSFPSGFPQFTARKALFELNRFFLFGAEKNDGPDEPQGFVASSSDGLVWQRAVLPEVGRLVDAVVGDSIIVAVTEDGSILSSATGSDWTVRWRSQDSSPVNFVGAAWGEGRFVALARDGVAMTSTNAVDWAPLGHTILGPDSQPLYSPFETYCDIVFADDLHEFYVFVDLALIKSFSVPVGGVVYHAHSRQNVFSYAATGHDNSAIGYHYGDANWWVQPPSERIPERFSLSRLVNDVVLHSPGRFSFKSRNFVEEPGPTFASEKILEGAEGSAIAFTRTGEIYQSATPLVVDSWSLVLQVPETEFTAAAYGNDRFVVVGRTAPMDSTETGVIYTSLDGRSWNRSFSSETIVRDVAYGHGFFAVIGERDSHGISLVSSNGVAWAPGEQIDGLPFENVAYGRGRFVASAFNGRPEVLSSVDGLNWRREQCTMDYRINEIAFTGETFLIFGPAGEILESALIHLELLPPASSRARIKVTSTYPKLAIEASSDLVNWTLFANDLNRFPLEPTSTIARTTISNLNTNSHRFYRARTAD